MSIRSRSVKVHLVHGTWARGFLGRGRAWTESGADVYSRLVAALPVDASVETFLWSGKNTVTAREEAAVGFRRHLARSAQRDPEALHIVVAHSHGGTVAANALLSSSPSPAPIRALICLATPFVYLIMPSRARLQTGLLAVAALPYALYWTALCALFPAIGTALTAETLAAVIAVKALVAFCLVVVIAIAIGEPQQARTLERPPAPEFPVYLLRATRDEASLSLSLAQVFDWFCAGFSRSHDVSQGSVRRPLSWVKYSVVYVSCVVLGAYLSTTIFDTLELRLPPEAIVLVGVFVYGPALAGIAYLLGYAALAVAVGHSKVARWLTTAIEVDAAPPGVMCNLLVYSELEMSSDEALRHGLYERDAVIGEIAALVAQVSR